jgi:methylglutaconyl-CoA hydratase
MYSTLLLQVGRDVATITLNRPEKCNAISAQMIADLLDSLDEVARGPQRVAIITGNGKSFCSGMDLQELPSLAKQSPEEAIADARRMAQLFRRLWSFPKPLIAAVNGAAMAGGCGIATLCDFTLTVPEATFGYTEVKIGFLPALVSVFLTRQIGEKRARDLLLTGRILPAVEAREFGLVSEIMPPERLLVRAQELAETLMTLSPTSLARTKRLLVDCAATGIDADLERAITENASIRSTPDFREGLAAFLEKRKPVWDGKDS